MQGDRRVGRRTKGRVEVEVAGRGKLEFAQCAAMDGYYVGEPERQVGRIVRKNFLNFAAEDLPFSRSVSLRIWSASASMRGLRWCPRLAPSDASTQSSWGSLGVIAARRRRSYRE